MKRITTDRALPRLVRGAVPVLLLLVLSCGNSEANGKPTSNPAERAKYYGRTSPGAYLMGRFSPSRHEKFVTLKSLGIPGNGRTHRLRREAAVDLRRMYLAFRKAHPGVPFRVISSTRPFYTQKSIWERKWNGKRRVEGLILTRSHPNHYKRGLKILRFSSMPGTSRHHWGTDFDITALNNNYFKSGKGKVLYDWLRANAGRYGFCQPYTAGRNKGYQEERWHWSYMPLARRFLRDWMAIYGRNTKLLSGKFAGAKTMHVKAPEYVTAISSSCR